MSTMKRALVVGGILVGLAVGCMRSAEARPSYLKVFETTYPDVATRNRLTCAVCHAGSDKTMRNDYGAALSRHIAKGEKGDARIKAALVATEPEPSAISGKTFGDLLKLGLLPASKVVQSQE